MSMYEVELRILVNSKYDDDAADHIIADIQFNLQTLRGFADVAVDSVTNLEETNDDNN